MLDGTVIQHESDVVDDWEGALCLLDRYPWHRLFPLLVHPEFKERVLQAIKDRYQATNIPNQYGMDRWMAICSSDPVD